MKSIIALAEKGQLSSGLMDKNHEEETERQIGKAFEVAGTVLCCAVLCHVVGWCCIALFLEYHS